MTAPSRAAPGLLFRILCSGKVRIEDMRARGLSYDEFTRLQGDEHVFNASRGFRGDPVLCIPLGRNLQRCHNLHTVFERQAHVGCSK